uniref:Ribonuclease H n=1 Tax=uncultured organism TaxID=155900 RepID=E0X768_9ZZZZ|nr:ribonuclease H [uncultured organism]
MPPSALPWLTKSCISSSCVADSPAEAVDSAILWSDGASRNNPGPAAIGVVLKRPTGELLASDAEYIGKTTNNVAEYRALLRGLERARALGVRNLEVRADSELLIRQLQGQYRVKNAALKPLWEEAKERLSHFASVRLKHVRRELNTEADALANAALDQAGF